MMAPMEEPQGGRHRREPDEQIGVGPDDLLQALLGEPPVYSRREVSARAGVTMHSSARLWHALGFPTTDHDVPAFTQADVAALARVAGLVRQEAMTEPTALAMTRAIARSMGRLAIWQAQLVAESLGEEAPGEPLPSSVRRAMPDPQTAQDAAAAIVRLADDLEPLLVYAWRRHLADALMRMLDDSQTQAEHPEVTRCVGFADLVSFSTLVRTLPERELAVVVERFESLASDIVTEYGGRVVKTVGDEVLFVTGDAVQAVGIALDLVAATGRDDLLPDLRVGIGFGPVVSRLGDVFGVTVNRASRLTGIATPGTVVVDEALAAELAGCEDVTVRRRRRRRLRGVGDVVPWVVRRAARRVVEEAAPAPAPGRAAPSEEVPPTPSDRAEPDRSALDG